MENFRELDTSLFARILEYALCDDEVEYKDSFGDELHYIGVPMVGYDVKEHISYNTEKDLLEISFNYGDDRFIIENLSQHIFPLDSDENVCDSWKDFCFVKKTGEFEDFLTDVGFGYQDCFQY